MATALVLPPPASYPYHRIVSPTLTIPSEPSVSIPVGILACQREPLLQELETVIVSALALVEKPPTVSKKGGKKSNALGNRAPIVEVLLHDTVLFPEGGGQACDFGTIKFLTEDAFDVVDVQRRGGHAVHCVILSKPHDAALFKPGVQVTVALGERGFKRRWDHMSMHTGQHLLSAILENEFNLPTLSWALTAHPSPSYVELPRSLSREEIAAIQDRVNRVAFEGRCVHVEVKEFDDQKNDVTVFENGRMSKGVPADYTGGVHRTVVIEGLDRSPCCGTHLLTTSSLQFFLLPQTESVARGLASTSRLLFLVGPRMVDYLTSSHNLVSTTSSMLSCSAALIPDRVAQVIDDRKKGTKRVEELEAEVASEIIEAVLKDMMSQRLVAPGGLIRIRRHRVEDNSNAFGFLSAIATRLFAKEVGGHWLVIFSSTPSSPSATANTLLLACGSDDKAVIAAGNALREQLGAKGGGKAPRWSGKVTGVWLESREGKAIDSILANL